MLFSLKNYATSDTAKHCCPNGSNGDSGGGNGSIDGAIVTDNIGHINNTNIMMMIIIATAVADAAVIAAVAVVVVMVVIIIASGGHLPWSALSWLP